MLGGFSALILGGGTGAAQAEAVAINQGTGQGLLFSHRGQCYAILPAHVHGRGLTVTLTTAAPSMVGDGAVFRSFSPGADLSIVHVRPGMQARCTEQWSALPERTDALLDRTSSGVLTRLSASGIEEHVEMQITSRDYDLLTAVPIASDARSEIFQGTSGAMLRVDGQIVGMAIQSSGTGEATFLRIDAIKATLARLLDARHANQSYALADPTLAEPQLEAVDGAGQCAMDSGFAIASVTCSREPVSPDFACSNLALGQPVRFAPGTERVEMILELAGASPIPLAAVQVASEASDGAVTAPRSIRVDIDSSGAASPRWRHFANADMSPFGAFSVKNGAAPYAGKIRVQIDSVWDPELPLQIDCIGFE